MSEDYAYACQRAELLGQSPPTEDEWAESQKSRENQANEEELEDAVVEGLDQSEESMKRVGGGLDELNSILNATQKKINRFKTVCGSLGTLLKVRVGSRSGTPDHKPSGEAALKETTADDETLTIEATATDPSVLGSNNDDATTTMTPRRIDINEKVGSHLDKLDSLITKAENAQYSMQHQTKQMKQIIKK